MITAPFDYRRAGSVDEAVSLLGELGEDAKLLAGGHSLLPLMKLRLAAPTTLIDIGGIGGLDTIEPNGGGFRIGALTRHVTLQNSPELGVIQPVAEGIADQQVRNRGTIGGSIAHGDPASDLPTAMLALEATFNVTGPGGERQIAAGEFFQDYLTTALEPQEFLTSIDIPSVDFGWGYEKFTRRAEDWAMVGVVALGQGRRRARGLHQHGLDRAAGDRRRGGAEGRLGGHRRHRFGAPSTPPTAPSPPAT